MLLLATVALGVPLALSLSARINEEVRTQARDQANVVAAGAADLLGSRSRPELNALATAAAVSLRGRVLIVDATGRVLVDSNGPAEVGSNYASRPELRRALAGTADQRMQQVELFPGQTDLRPVAPDAPRDGVYLDTLN